jgi:hypothetical protein
MFAHIENTYFSQGWWNSLSAAEKDHIRALADVASPYYEPFPLLPLKLVPWQITGISRHDYAGCRSSSKGTSGQPVEGTFLDPTNYS